MENINLIFLIVGAFTNLVFAVTLTVFVCEEVIA